MSARLRPVQPHRIESDAAYQSECGPGGPYGALQQADLLAPPRPRAAPETAVRPKRRAVQDRYDELVRDMKILHGLRVRRWRSSTSGCAWIVRYADGTESRLIESPYPRGPMSCAVFLHEVGHHAIGFGTYTPRCLEEYHAWRWALRTMLERGLNVTPAVEKRMHEAVCYAIDKARRRGLKRLPADLAAYAGAPGGDGNGRARPA